MSKTMKFISIFIFSLFSCGSFVYSGNISTDFVPAQVLDISDRKYEKSVISLLDNAEESIIMSMYLINPLAKGPVKLLVGDLGEALNRGVRVEIYLNSRFDFNFEGKRHIKEPLVRLQKMGAKIYPVSSNYRLHDKLIIVDGRYVVEGSVNWSVSAIKNNYESAVLIDSPDLAKIKLLRLRQLPLEGVVSKVTQRPDRVKRKKTYAEGESVKLSKSLLLDKQLFPNMLKHRDKRSMDTYLLLLAEAKYSGGDEFFLSLEELAIELGMPETWSDTALRRQTIKTLKKIKNKYKLIDVTFLHGKDAWVELKDIPGDNFNFEFKMLYEKYLPLESSAAKYTLLIIQCLKSEGKTFDSFTRAEISKRFTIYIDSLRKGLKELSYN